MRALPTLLWLSLGTGLLGCPGHDDYDDTRERGDLGRGSFVYACVSDGDSACATSSTPSLPQAIAVGGLFDVRFAIDGTGAQPTVISPASDVVRHTAAGFLAQSAGTFALLAVNGNSEVIDLKHLRAADIAEVRVQHAKELASRSVSVDVGEVLQLTAQPFDADGVRLAGTLDYTWSSANEDVLQVESLTDLNSVRLRGRSNGTTTLRVETAGTSYTVDVVVGSGDPSLDAGEIDSGVTELDASALDGAVVAEEDAGLLPDAGADANSNDAAIDGGVQ